MKSTVARIVVAVVLVAAFSLGTEAMRIRGGVTKDITLPMIKLDTLPTVIGFWKGKDRDVDDRLFRVIGADDVVSRAYENPAGTTIVLHAAVFGDYFRGAPHPPTVCYPSSGWTTMEQKDVQLTAADGAKFPVREVTYDMEGHREMIMFWYQLGDRVFTDDAGLQESRRALRKCRTWPAIVKVLVSTPVHNPEQTEAQLVDFANQVYAWTGQIQKNDEPAVVEPAEVPANDQAETP